MSLSQYPGALDAFQNPTAASSFGDAGVVHHVQHAQVNDAIAAMQAKLGISGSSDVNSHEYKIGQLQVAAANDPPTAYGNVPIFITQTDNTMVATTVQAADCWSQVFPSGNTYHFNVRFNAAGLPVVIGPWGPGASGAVLGPDGVTYF